MSVDEPYQAIHHPVCATCGGVVEWCQKYGFHYPYGEQFFVCGRCAESIANVFWKKHNGDWLTWGSKPSCAPRATQVSVGLRWEVLREAAYTCAACGANDRPMHVDHIIPRAAGGGNEKENLQALCDKCNLAKGART